MTTVSKLRLTGRQHHSLLAHLFPGDGCEAVALALCGRLHIDDSHTLLVHEIVPIPNNECKIRRPDLITWSTEGLPSVLQQAASRGMAILKVHSHPGGLAAFSDQDDRSDRDFFRSVYGWMDDDRPHASAIILPSGKILARSVLPSGAFSQVPRVSVTGDDLSFYGASFSDAPVTASADRHARAFGAATVNLLGDLSIAVVGCSGTGGPVIEQLARLGVGKITLVDPDVVNIENLNRIPNAMFTDAEIGAPKVDVAARAVANMGLGTIVNTVAQPLSRPAVIAAVAGCDVVFGCMDSVDGRQMLNRLATFYHVPYFDVGVQIVVGVDGAIDQVCGAVHYLQPGGSSLMSRGVITEGALRAEAMRHQDPSTYEGLLDEGYIQGALEPRPAVVSINTLFASRAVIEFLARLHPFRLHSNADSAIVRETISGSLVQREPEGALDEVLAKNAGRGDMKPLLDMPELSQSRQ